MKILSVRFQNLNSLAGEWEIDFTHPAYASDGIFAITGATGSGKTTILDAICLGLYGRTPRLDRVTKSSNEIMSRQTGACFAEVTFETQKGRYRCHWSQHRSRKKSSGELQQAKHEIADAETGVVLESRINQVSEFIEKATGMDFERFTRSMLLAQGGFAAFLQAAPDDRSPILEQITGTGIYSLISMKVHERRREEQEKLELLKAELQGIQVLSEEEEAELQAKLKEKQGRENELAEKINITRQSVTWSEGIAALVKDLAELEEKSHELTERRAAFAPELEKLEKSRKALAIDGDYKEVAALRRGQAAEAKELDGVTALIPEKEKILAEALNARSNAENNLNAARARQSAEGQVIKKVRELDARWSEKKQQVEETQKALADIRKQADAYKAGMEKSRLLLKQAFRDIESVNDYLTQHVVDAALTANLTAISKSFARLGDIDVKHVKVCESLLLARGKKESALIECQKIETGYENLRREFEKHQNDHKLLTDEINAILQGRDISQWRRELETVNERNRLLMQTNDILERVSATRKNLDEDAANLKLLQIGREQILQNIKEAAQRKSNLEREIENMEMQVSLLARIRDLEEDRKRLEDGTPCPLCGACDHPYARGNVPELDESEKALKKLKAEFDRESGIQSRLEADRAKKEAEIQHIEKDITKQKAALIKDEIQCAELLHLLDITVTAEERAAKIREELAAIKKLIAETGGIVAAAEEKSKKEKLSQTVLEKMREQFENSGKALQEAKHKLEMAENEGTRLAGELEILSAEFEKVRGEALHEVEQFGITQIDPARLDAVMKDLICRKTNWEAKQNEKTVLEKKLSELNAALDKDNAVLINLENDLVLRGKASDEQLAQCESLKTDRRELFGERNPDREERNLADTVSQAEKILADSREKYGQIEKEISALKEKIELLKSNLRRRGRELAEAEQTLKEKVEKSGFENEADFLSSCLTEGERETLADQEKSLIEEKTQLEARIKDKAETLSLERSRNLTYQSTEALKENMGIYESDLKQLRLDIGGIVQRLRENEKQREIRRESIRAMEARKKECARWEALHDLIGSADGKKFRNFAQGLTFEVMTAQANRQLRKMTDRYLLIRDAAQPLELNVIDNYQAGEIRSTKNLSGGESFLVSLALALGLSQMASRNVRVDSLFLDEGFGTLDDDALETALETLAGLQQDGKLIGVISHVPALKERIGTQITVVPETGGRSSLTGPGCRRI